MKNRLFKALILVSAMIMVLSGCGKKEEPKPVDPPKHEDPTPITPIPEPQPDKNIYQNPLNGTMGAEDVSKVRPYAVMINNNINAQPQHGISQADIIYEVMAEGGVTRMLAVYSSLNDVGVIGSVRSSRPYYIDLALGHDAIYVHAGGSDDAYAMIEKLNVDRMDGVNGKKDADIFYRDADRKAQGYKYEHTLMTKGESAVKYVKSSGMRATLKSTYKPSLVFGKTAATANGADAEKVTVNFHIAADPKNNYVDVFEYDSSKELYMVSEFGKAKVDGNTKEQLGVKNLIVLETNGKVDTKDQYKRMEFVTTGSGRGTYFCEGKAINITWERKSNTDPIVYKTGSGKDLELMPGNTYVCVLNTVKNPGTEVSTYEF